jgi:hypothetical protein
MDYASFTVAFPEFAATPQAFVESRLAAAAHHVSAARWGDRYAYAVALKAAHMLALSPYGEHMRLSKTSPETIYGQLFKEELNALPVRMMVVGGGGWPFGCP